MLAVAIAMLAVTWWGGWTVGQTQVFAADAPAAAADVETFTVYRINTPGDYVMQGNTLVRYGSIPTPPFPPPDDPVVPPTPPVPVDELSEAVTAAVNTIPATDARHAAALKMSAICQVLGSQISTGKIHPTDGPQALQLIGKAGLGKDAKTWEPVLAVIESALAKATTAEASAKILETAGAAVLATVPDSDAAVATMQAGGEIGENAAFKSLAEKYGFDWDKFLEFLMQLLMLLLPLITWVVPNLAFAMMFA